MNNLKNDVKNIISVLILENPLIGIFLRKTWIFADVNVKTAYTDGLSIYINPEFFRNLPVNDKKHLLIHEILHIMLKHKTRTQRYISSRNISVNEMLRHIINLVLDAEVSKYNDVRTTVLKPVTFDKLSKVFKISLNNNMSFEEAMDKILSIMNKSNAVNVNQQQLQGLTNMPVNDVFNVLGKYERGKRKTGEESGKSGNNKKERSDKGSYDKDGKEVLNEGEEKRKDGMSDEEIEKIIDKKLASSLTTAKAVGTVPEELERIINELLKPVVDWRKLLLSNLRNVVGSKVRRKWSKYNKKLPESHPGKMLYGVDTITVLVDTSGSVTEDELQRYLSEVYGVVKQLKPRNVVIIPWDAEVYEPIILRKASDVKKVKVTGGGGTVILPALKLFDKKYSSSEALIIMSDWAIYDISDNDVIKLLRKYKDRTIALTTERDPPKLIKHVIKLKP